SRNLALAQVGDLRNRGIVAIAMEDRQSVADRTGRNHAVHTGADREPGATRTPVEIDGVEEDGGADRRLDDRQGEHGLTRLTERRVAREPLQDLLHDRQAGDDLVEIYDGFQREARRLAKDLDPGGRVNENHAASSRRPASPREPSPARPPRPPTL